MAAFAITSIEKVVGKVRDRYVKSHWNRVSVLYYRLEQTNFIRSPLARVKKGGTGIFSPLKKKGAGIFSPLKKWGGRIWRDLGHFSLKLTPMDNTLAPTNNLYSTQLRTAIFLSLE